MAPDLKPVERIILFSDNVNSVPTVAQICEALGDDYKVTVVNAERWNQILVPIGFAHGFVTLEPDTEVLYKMTNFYSAKHERGIVWNDPKLAIDWGIGEEAAKLSDKDRILPTLDDATELFDYSA